VLIGQESTSLHRNNLCLGDMQKSSKAVAHPTDLVEYANTGCNKMMCVALPQQIYVKSKSGDCPNWAYITGGESHWIKKLQSLISVRGQYGLDPVTAF